MNVLYYFYICGSYLPSWIRIQQLKLMQIHAHPDPQPWPYHTKPSRTIPCYWIQSCGSASLSWETEYLLLLIKVMLISGLWPRPSTAHFEPPGIQFERPWPSLAPFFEPLKLLNLYFSLDKNPAFYSNADPGPAPAFYFDAESDSCEGSGSTTNFEDVFCVLRLCYYFRVLTTSCSTSMWRPSMSGIPGT